MAYIDILLTAAQWLIIFLFIFIGFLVGARRGFKKSYYYTITNLLLTVVILIGISFVSIRMIFSTPGALLDFAEKYLSISPETRSYLDNPNVSPVMFALIDIVFKLVVFFVSYPILKLLFNLFLFAPLRRLFFNRKRVVFNKRTLTMRDDRHINSLSRFSGGVLGAFRGLLLVFLLFIPLIVISGSLNQLDSGQQTEPLANRHKYHLVNSKTADEEEEDDAGLFDINLSTGMKAVKNFNKYGLGRFVKKIKNDEGSLDEVMFDSFFSGNIITEDSEGVKHKEKLRFAQEVNLYGSIFETLLDGGYLEKGYDFKTINLEDDYENIDYVLTSLGKSKLVNLAIPIVLDMLENEGVFEDQLGFKLSEVNGNDITLNHIKRIDWSEELVTLSKVVEKALTIGNVGELEVMFSNPNDLLNLPTSEQNLIIDTFEQLSELDLLVALNVGLEYALRNEDVQKQIKWNDEPEEYLRERYGFIFNDSKFFKNEILGISNLLRTVFSDEFEDYDFKQLYQNNKVNLDYILTDDSREFVVAVLNDLVDLKIVINSIPVGIDFAVHQSPIDIGEVSKNKIDEIIQNANYGDEIGHFDSIYENIIKLGISSLLEDNVVYLDAIDEILKEEGTFDALKEIVDVILVQSEVVNEMLEYGSDKLIHKLIKNQNVKDIVLEINDIENFNYGLEVKNILNMAEILYRTTDINTVKTDFNNKDYEKLVYNLSGLTRQDYEEFKTNLFGLQTLEMIDQSNLEKLVALNSQVEKYVTIPENVNKDSFVADVERILDIVLEVGLVAYNNNLSYKEWKDIDVSKIFEKETFEELFTFDEVRDANSIVLHSFVNNLKKVKLNVRSLPTLTVAPKYLALDPNSPEWIEELNTIAIGGLNVLDEMYDYDSFVFSYNNVLRVLDEKKYNELPVNLLKELIKDKDNALVAKSYNLRYIGTVLLESDELSNEVTNAVKRFTGIDIGYINLKPEANHLDEDGLFKKSELLGAARSAKIAFDRLYDSNPVERYNKFYNLIDNGELDLLLQTDYGRVMISRVLESEFVLNQISNVTKIDRSELTFELVERDANNNITKDEILNLIVAARQLDIKQVKGLNLNTLKLENLTTDKLEKMLDSNYVYQVADKLLKDQLGDNMPAAAIENGYVKHEELVKLAHIPSIIDVTKGININTFTLKQIDELHDLDSILVNAMLSKHIIQLIDVPEEVIHDEVIERNEIKGLLELVRLINDGKADEEIYLTDIDLDEIELTTTLYRQLLDIEDAKIVRRLVSEAVIETFDADLLTGLLENNDLDVKESELEAIYETLVNLGIDRLDEEIDVDLITIDKLIVATDDTEIISTIIYRLISNSIVDILGSDDTESTLDSNGEYIKLDELNKLFKAINILLPNKSVTDLSNEDFNLLLINNLVDANNEDSLIVRRLISNEIIGKNPFVVDQSVTENNNKDILEDELKHLLAAAGSIDDVETIDDLIDELNELENKDPVADMAYILDLKAKVSQSKILTDTVESIINS